MSGYYLPFGYLRISDTNDGRLFRSVLRKQCGNCGHLSGSVKDNFDGKEKITPLDFGYEFYRFGFLSVKFMRYGNVSSLT